MQRYTAFFTILLLALATFSIPTKATSDPCVVRYTSCNANTRPVDAVCVLRRDSRSDPNDVSTCSFIQRSLDFRVREQDKCMRRVACRMSRQTRTCQWENRNLLGEAAILPCRIIITDVISSILNNPTPSYVPPTPSSSIAPATTTEGSSVSTPTVSASSSIATDFPSTASPSVSVPPYIPPTVPTTSAASTPASTPLPSVGNSVQTSPSSTAIPTSTVVPPIYIAPSPSSSSSPSSTVVASSTATAAATTTPTSPSYSSNNPLVQCLNVADFKATARCLFPRIFATLSRPNRNRTVVSMFVTYVTEINPVPGWCNTYTDRLTRIVEQQLSDEALAGIADALFNELLVKEDLVKTLMRNMVN